MNALVNNQFRPRNIIKTQSTRLIMLLSFGLLFYACNEMQNPVAEISSPESSDSHKTTTSAVNTIPIKISGFKIKFNGMVYDETDDQSTFNYTVTRGNDATGFNYLFFETPSCAVADLAGYTPDNGDENVTGDGTEGIKWTASIGSGSSRDYSIIYNGKKSIGMVDATIQSSGSSTTETKEIPGPCKGIFTISGFIYVDENGNQEKDAGEGGIGNVTVHLTNEFDVEYTETTSSNGSYAFNVFAGSSSKDFTLQVRSASNVALFNNFSPTTNPPELNVTVNKTDVTGKNLGFKAETEKIIKEFEEEIIKLKTEKPKFWAGEYKFADKGRKTVFTKTQLLGFLQKIDDVEDGYLDLYDFEFGIEDNDRINKAQDILTVKGNSTELERLRAELLAAMLNVVSENGAVDEDDNPLVEFNDLIIKTGIAALNTLEIGANSALIMNSTTYETTTFTSTASLSTSRDLLTSFNGSGGGIGTK